MRPNWQTASQHLLFALALSAVALLGLRSQMTMGQMTGILLGAFSQLLWFVLLHECGHRSFFPRQWANDALGHLAGIAAIIPYSTWRDVHAHHHLWTGWKDLDPTTRAVAQTAPAGWKAILINGIWRLRLPVFGLVYRLSNFWNPGMCRRGKAAGMISIALTLGPWLAILYAARELWLPLLLTHGLFLLFFEGIMLSQHTHITQSRACGRKVSPFRSSEQVSVTRSLAFPPSFARWFLLHFNEHEKHHEFPHVPGYHLDRVAGSGERKMHWLRWWQQSHAVPGATLLFEDESRTGIRL